MCLAIVLFALSLASCSLLMNSACSRTVLPAVAPPPIELEGVRVTKIVIAEDVDDRAILCVQVTSEMRLERIVGPEVCGFSVGELRREFAHLSNAN